MSTRAVVEHDFGTVIASDLETTLADDTEDSLLLLPGAAVSGFEALREFFGWLPARGRFGRRRRRVRARDVPHTLRGPGYQAIPSQVVTVIDCFFNWWVDRAPRGLHQTKSGCAQLHVQRRVGQQGRVSAGNLIPLMHSTVGAIG